MGGESVPDFPYRYIVIDLIKSIDGIILDLSVSISKILIAGYWFIGTSITSIIELINRDMVINWVYLVLKNWVNIGNCELNELLIIIPSEA